MCHSCHKVPEKEKIVYWTSEAIQREGRHKLKDMDVTLDVCECIIFGEGRMKANERWQSRKRSEPSSLFLSFCVCVHIQNT